DRAWSVSSTVGVTLVDPDRLEAALDCLLENSVKFTKPGDVIEVRGAFSVSGWMVSVRDEGVGMTPELARALTDGPPLPGNRAGSGTGLGLAIARAVATSWGGELRVAGCTDRGAEVTLCIPWRPPAPALDSVDDTRPASLFSAMVTLPGAGRVT